MEDSNINRPRLISKLSIANFAVLFALVGTFFLVHSFAAGTTCDQTFSNIASLQAAVSTSSAAGQTICISPGSYGNVALSGTHSSNVIVTADPSLDPNGSGKVTIGKLTISGTFVVVKNLYITAGVQGATGSGDDTIDHNDVSNPGGYGIDFLTSSNYTITGNRIHGTTVNSEGDALRFDQVNNVTIAYNEITNIVECNSNTCHTDCFQTYNGGVTTNNVVFDHNYMHDNRCQGPPFLKDGDINPNVTITNNLDVRNTGNAGTFAIAENTSNLIVRQNTYVGTTGSYIQTGGSSTNPTVFLDHNVFDQISVTGGYSLNEDYNIFTDGNQWSFNLGPHDLPHSGNAYGDKYSPAYLCSATCGNGTTASDDYRLASNPNNVGIDWAPSQFNYGPINTSSPAPPPGGGSSGGSDGSSSSNSNSDQKNSSSSPSSPGQSSEPGVVSNSPAVGSSSAINTNNTSTSSLKEKAKRTSLKVLLFSFMGGSALIMLVVLDWWVLDGRLGIKKIAQNLLRLVRNNGRGASPSSLPPPTIITPSR